MRKSRAAAGTALFLALAPGIVAGLAPWWLTGGWQARAALPAWWWAARAAGVLLLAAALPVLLGAFARFVSEGLGTPAPVAPTERLVVGGAYRHVRNPMYVAVTAAVLGQALLLGRPVLVAYAAGVGTLMAAFARWHEEPALRRRFGAEYDAYRRAVPGWRPRLRPWRPGGPIGRGPGEDRQARA